VFNSERRKGTCDVSAAGLSPATHPLLGAFTDLADQDQMVFTGRLAPSVGGDVVVSDAAIIDVLLHAAALTDCPAIDELAFHHTLVVVEETDLQVTVHLAEDDARRTFAVHSRPAGRHAPWIVHATGILHSDPYRVIRTSLGHPTYVDVDLPASVADVAGYGIHPALLDAALHALAAEVGHAESRSFRGITLHARGATRLHVALASAGPDTYSLHAFDDGSSPVITIAAITPPPATVRVCRATRRR